MIKLLINKTNLSDNSIELLKQNFLFIKFIWEIFPTSSELEEIKQTLLKNKILKSRSILQNHNQVYLLLLLLNMFHFILFFIITLFAIIIIAKQIKLWFHGT